MDQHKLIPSDIGMAPVQMVKNGLEPNPQNVRVFDALFGIGKRL